MEFCLIWALRAYCGLIETDRYSSLSMVRLYCVNQMDHLGDQTRMHLLPYTATVYLSYFLWLK